MKKSSSSRRIKPANPRKEIGEGYLTKPVERRRKRKWRPERRFYPGRRKPEQASGGSNQSGNNFADMRGPVQNVPTAQRRHATANPKSTPPAGTGEKPTPRLGPLSSTQPALDNESRQPMGGRQRRRTRTELANSHANSCSSDLVSPSTTVRHESDGGALFWTPWPRSPRVVANRFHVFRLDVSFFFLQKGIRIETKQQTIITKEHLTFFLLDADSLPNKD